MNGFPNIREKGKHFCSGTVKIGALFQKCLPRFGESAEQLRSNSQPFAIMVVSCLQLAKRAFVRVLLTFAAQYQVAITVNRDSSDSDVLAAYRRLVRRAHPDKGGRHEDIQVINAARDKWDEVSWHGGVGQVRWMLQPIAFCALRARGIFRFLF